MPWAQPLFSRNHVNQAGNILIDPASTPEQKQQAVDILNNWRSCHGYPINTFQATLRDKLAIIDPESVVAQRLKRTPSIILKLQRYHNMQLSRMQDVGGLRAVVSNIAKVRELEDNYKHSRFAHELVTEDDYINTPKASGYRSIHLIYKYRNPRAPAYNGLLIELQIRTRLQHAWATAVETVGTFINHSLKASVGPKMWLDFFALTSSAFAYLENLPPVPGYEKHSEEEIFANVTHVAQQQKIKEHLQAFAAATKVISSGRQSGNYHLLILDPIARLVRLNSFGLSRLEEANNAYEDVEKRIANGEKLQAVLVSTSTIDNLKRAYPNYFLDTREFVNHLDHIASKCK